MLTTLSFFGAVFLFLISLRLSAFFSGTETGFYRASFLRLSIDAHAGDSVASRIMWFARNPSYFVATTLVGNNVANYLTTFAIGLVTAMFYQNTSGWPEIVSTLLLSPVIFVFGELVPKNLYYRAPLQLLRRDAAWIVFFFRLFFVVTFPLIWVTRMFERLGGARDESWQLVLGRSRLVQVLTQGHQEGILTDIQSRLVHGLMQAAERPVTETMTPVGKVLGVGEDTPREDVLKLAQRNGLTVTPVKRAGSESDWFGYLRVFDLALGQERLASATRNMPRIDSACNKLEAMQILRDAGAVYGIITSDQEVVGIVSDRGLVEQMFRSPQALGTRFPSAD